MNDLTRGLITDAQGEFVQQFPGGAFDPRTFRRKAASSSDAAAPTSASPAFPAGGDESAGSEQIGPGR